MNRSFYLQELEPELKQLAASYFDLVELGGKVVPSLIEIGEREPSLRSKVSQLLQDIKKRTKSRLQSKAQTLLCSHCLTRCSIHRQQIPWLNRSAVYYGCKSCGQSHGFIFAAEYVVAVLDTQMKAKVTRKMDLIRVNWLVHRKIFDFDQIKIVQATDEDVERLAVQIGNDTDMARLKAYKTMLCLVSPDCKLTKNTMWILKERVGLDVRDINSVRDRYSSIREVPVC